MYYKGYTSNPPKMKPSFTTEEIEKASKSMKTRKRVGDDGLDYMQNM